jgi:hypothetical protein
MTSPQSPLSTGYRHRTTANQNNPRPAKISLYTLLGSAILIAFAILVTANLWGQYRLTNQIIDKEMTHAVRQHHALLKTVLNGQLKLLNNQLQMLSRQEELTSLDPNSRLAEIDTQLKALTDNQSQASANDFILLGSLDGQDCLNAYQIFTAEPINCDELIPQFDSDLFDWHLAKINTGETPILTTLTRTPIVVENGRVLAYLYGGVVLTGNFSVLNQVIGAGGIQTSAVGISYQNQIIASSAPQGSAQYQALQQAAAYPDSQIKTLEANLYSFSQRIQLEHSLKLDVRLVSVVGTDGRDELQQGMIQQTSGILILSILLAILVVSLTIKVSLTPLGRLRDLARQRQNQTLTAFDPGPITEFQQLSFEVARILTDLKNTERKLRQNSHLLALSHKEQKALNTRNRKLLHQLLNLQEQERKYLAQ